MMRVVTPHLRIDSVLELDVTRLRTLGLDALLLDLDCTLKDHPAQEFRPEITAWARTLRDAGIQLCIFSNGRPARVGRLAALLDIPYVAQALKPSPHRCKQALSTLGVESDRTAIVGDQIFADVLAGRLAGLYTILVRPTSPEEPWFTRLKRPPERAVLWWLERSDRRPPRVK